MTHDPIQRYLEALARAQQTETFDATRAALATADARGRPTVRFVLVKIADSRGFVFFTNYESRKAREFEANPWGGLAWHWFSTGEQVRADGPVEKISREQSAAYFATRPRGSQIAAWASKQSSPVASPEELDRSVERERSRFEGRNVELPPFWGGFLLVPEQMEFWKDGVSRLHDRWLYTRQSGGWTMQLLSP